MRMMGSLIDSIRNGEETALRHHNPYLKESLNFSKYLVTQQELSDKFTDLFADSSRRLVLEIGCYMGKTLVELAQQNQDINFFGLDITYKRAVKTARKLQNIPNARVGLCHGQIFLQDIAWDESLHGVCLFFPDPWPKERQRKNRLIKDEFAKILFNKLQHHGFFWLKTDHEEYFIESKKILLKAGFSLSNEPIPSSIKGGPYETPFQKLFVSQGLSFYQGIFVKN